MLNGLKKTEMWKPDTSCDEVVESSVQEVGSEKVMLLGAVVEDGHEKKIKYNGRDVLIHQARLCMYQF